MEFKDGDKVRVVAPELFDYSSYPYRYKTGEIVTVMIGPRTDGDVHLEMPGEKDGFWLTDEEFEAVELIEEDDEDGL